MRGYISWGVPLIIILVYLKGYYDFFSPKGTGMLIFWMCFALLLLGSILAIAFHQGKKSR